MLIRAVGDDDENTKGSSKILDCLGLTSSGWTSWGSSEKHAKSLGKGDVASISKWCDTKSLLGSEELIGVDELDISDIDSAMSLFYFPVASGVSLPREIVGILNLVLSALSLDINENLHLTHMDCHDCLDSHSDLLVHVFKTHLGKLRLNVVDEFLTLVKLNDLFFVTLLKALLDFEGPEELNTKKGNLRWELEHEVSEWSVEAISGTSLADVSDRGLHALFELY